MRNISNYCEYPIIFFLIGNPVIDVLGSLKRVLYEDSSLYLTATVFYEANSVTLSVIHNESRHVFPSSQRNEIIFTNETILWKLPNVSRLYEGHFYVKGIGNLLSTDSTFQSVVVEVQIIRMSVERRLHQILLLINF